MSRVGVIHNIRSRRNRGAEPAPPPAGVLMATPNSHDELDAALAHFAAEEVDLLVVDGGDGTVRDVMTQAPDHFPDRTPTMAVLPSGKTNALAFDLGAPREWTLEALLESAARGRTDRRRQLEVFRAGAEAPLARGFIFGAGAFVRATQLAQRAHRLGAFESVAVALTLAAAALRTLLGGPRSGWRSGEPMRLSFESEPLHDGQILLLLVSTLERLPLGVHPFGAHVPDGLRTLTVEAPPKQLLRALPPLLAGKEPSWLEAAGYHRRAVERIDVAAEGGFVLDGETYPGGEYSLRVGDAVEFVVP
ncbi:diacylglycerol kinase family protein [Phenylobacterium sp. LjRoot225]|uniref:diacylglycerol/lipid kinase family protein n=1 Tax=Phenylobacterium sp. LjRoot225 TaxID=3342285 RepID=UPI003ED0902E